MTQGNTTIDIKPGQSIGSQRLLRLLSGMGISREPIRTSSFFLTPGDIPGLLANSGGEGDAWLRRLHELGNNVMRSDTGLAGFRSGVRGVVVMPPFPLTSSCFSTRWDIGPLADLLQADFTIGVVLLRLGRFSVAVYEGQTLVSSKTDSRYVKGRHSAGGTSQQRYVRIREGQIHRLYDKTCQAVRDQFGPYNDRLDYVFLGGESQTLNGFLKECHQLERLKATLLNRRLNVRDPKQDTLGRVGETLWESRIWPVEW